MKNLKFLLVICAVALLSGCYKFEAKMTIKDDKQMDFEIVYGIYNTDSLMEGFGTEEETTEEETTGEEETTIGEETTTIEGEEETTLDLEDDEDITGDLTSIDCDEIKNNLGEGWTVEEYQDTEYKGCKIKKSYASIDDISSSKDVVVELTNITDGKFDDKQMFKKSGNKYSANFRFTVDESQSEMIEQYKSLFKLSYVVELPSKNTSNNATKVENDGKTLIWEITPEKTTDIKFSFKLGKSEFPWLYVGIAAGAVVLIVVIILIVCGCKKNCKCNCSNCECTNNEPKEENKVEETPVVEEPVEEVNEPAVEETPVTEEPVEEVTEAAVEENTEEVKTTEENNQ